MHADLLAWPDPLLYRQELPVALRRDFEWGFISREELWQRLALLWDREKVVDFVSAPKRGVR